MGEDKEGNAILKEKQLTEAIKVRVESSDGSGPNDESFHLHQVRRRGALPLRGYSCTHIACVCNSLELARRNARPPNSGKGRA